MVHIISIVQAAVVGQLPLPPGATVAELSAAAGCPGLLLVLCRDGSLQLWQISSGVCLWSAKTDAFAAVGAPPLNRLDPEQQSYSNTMLQQSGSMSIVPRDARSML